MIPERAGTLLSGCREGRRKVDGGQTYPMPTIPLSTPAAKRTSAERPATLALWGGSRPFPAGCSACEADGPCRSGRLISLCSLPPRSSLPAQATVALAPGLSSPPLPGARAPSRAPSASGGAGRPPCSARQRRESRGHTRARASPTRRPARASPASTARGPRADNAQERANEGMKRRTGVVGAFPSAGSTMRPVSPVPIDANEGWPGTNFVDAASPKGVRRPEPDPAPIPDDVAELARIRAGRP